MQDTLYSIECYSIEWRFEQNVSTAKAKMTAIIHGYLLNTKSHTFRHILRGACIGRRYGNRGGL